MLKQRVITAAILSGFVLWALLGWSDLFFAVFLLLAVMACAWEWSNLVAVDSQVLRQAYAAIMVVTAAVSFYLSNLMALTPMVLAAVILWIANTGDLIVRPVIVATKTTGGSDSQARVTPRWTLLALASFILLVAVCCLFWLRKEHGAGIVIYTIVLVAVADTGAYFVGRKFGRRKLASEISGGKTIEGALGGVALAVLFAALVCGFGIDAINGASGNDVNSNPISAWSLFAMSVFAAPVSIAGDLYISRAKRTRDVKDSGTLLPGHGGVLDRVDGLLAAIPFMAFAAIWL